MIEDNQKHGTGAEEDGKNEEVVVRNHGDGEGCSQGPGSVMIVWESELAHWSIAGSEERN